jgi:hypothetical protein
VLNLSLKKKSETTFPLRISMALKILSRYSLVGYFPPKIRADGVGTIISVRSHRSAPCDRMVLIIEMFCCYGAFGSL